MIAYNAPLSEANVLVIGGTGFMGIWLVAQLIKWDNSVTIATRGTHSDPFGNKINRLHMNILDAEGVRSALKGRRFDVIFDDLAYVPSNVENILSNVSCERYIQLSSVMAYENFKEELKETDLDPRVIKLEELPVEQYEGQYAKGKRLSEACVFQKFPNVPAVTVRLPFVAPSSHLLSYCEGVVDQTPLNISDTQRKMTFIQAEEVGKFLPWIAAQNFTGPINLASEGMVTVGEIIDYIERQTGKRAIIEPKKLSEESFCDVNSNSFSMSMEKARQLGYKTSNLYSWLWTTLDEYIAKASRKI